MPEQVTPETFTVMLAGLTGVSLNYDQLAAYRFAWGGTILSAQGLPEVLVFVVIVVVSTIV